MQLILIVGGDLHDTGTTSKADGLSSTAPDAVKPSDEDKRRS